MRKARERGKMEKEDGERRMDLRGKWDGLERGKEKG